MTKRRIVAAGFAGLLAASDPAAGHEAQVTGWLELARLYPSGLTIRAKLDTGARTSSLNARHATRFFRAGRPWVRFSVSNARGGTATFERPIHRAATIRRVGAEPEERIVVILGICLATVYAESEVNLTDRSDMTYQMLIGRTFLSGNIVVDASRTFRTRPDCAKARGK